MAIIVFPVVAATSKPSRVCIATPKSVALLAPGIDEGIANSRQPEDTAASVSENVMRKARQLPVQYVINYDAILQAARDNGAADLALFLQRHLPLKWRDVYAAAAAHPTNIVHLKFGTFEYICDLYSQLEAAGEVAYDQTIRNRVVAVLGKSARTEGERNAGRFQSWGENDVFETERDNGHFMAHCIGGGLEVNVFSQDRQLNRGWSARGKVYRQMENYCRDCPGTFCFSRPLYTASSNIPRWLEFGVLKADGDLWVEVFDN